MSASKRFYVTTAIDYANGPPHMGHAFEKIGADAMVRYHHRKGEAVHFVIGMDEHGLKVLQSAEAAGITPGEWVDRSRLFRDAWDRPGSGTTTHPTTEPATTRRSRRSNGSTPRATCTADVRRVLLCGVRGVQARGRAGPRRRRGCWLRARCPLHPALNIVDGRGELVLPPLALPGAAPAAARRAARVRAAGDPAQRDPERHRGRTRGHLRLPRSSVVGRALARRSRAYGLRLDRRAHELPLGHRIPGGILPRVLARGLPRRRQGHHALPLHLLAGDADERGDRAARTVWAHGWVTLETASSKTAGVGVS